MGVPNGLILAVTSMSRPDREKLTSVSIAQIFKNVDNREMLFDISDRFRNIIENLLIKWNYFLFIYFDKSFKIIIILKTVKILKRFLKITINFNIFNIL